MKKEFLDIEKNYQDFFKYIEKVLRIQQKLSERKKTYLDDFKLSSHVLNEEYKGLKKLVHGRKLIKQKQKQIIILKKIKEKILAKILKQEEIIPKQIINLRDRENLFEKIIQLPFFQSLTPKEQQLVQEIIYKRVDKIREIISFLEKDKVNYQSEREIITKLELHEDRSYKYKEEEEFGGEEIDHLKDFHIKLNKLIQYELDGIVKCREIIAYLVKDSKRIIEENKEMENSFNPVDLTHFKELIGTELLKEENKIQGLQRFMKKQRRLAEVIEPHNLIAVHLTNHFPKSGVIDTSGNLKMLEINGHKLHFPRQTIHFTLNGPVESHIYGNWDDCKIGILIPFEKMVDRALVLDPTDTWVLGKVELPVGSEIVVPWTKDEKTISRYKQNAPNATIIVKNEGETTHQAVIRRIRERGYTPMNIVGWSWGEPIDEEDIDWLKELFEGPDSYNIKSSDISTSLNELRNKLNLFIGNHQVSLWGTLEKFAQYAYSIIYSENPENPETIREYKNATDKIISILQKKKKKLTSDDEIDANAKIQKIIRVIKKSLHNKETSTHAEEMRKDLEIINIINSYSKYDNDDL